MAATSEAYSCSHGGEMLPVGRAHGGGVEDQLRKIMVKRLAVHRNFLSLADAPDCCAGRE
jgi:hypothetical protein